MHPSNLRNVLYFRKEVSKTNQLNDKFKKGEFVDLNVSGYNVVLDGDYSTDEWGVFLVLWDDETKQTMSIKVGTNFAKAIPKMILKNMKVAEGLNRKKAGPSYCVEKQS